MRGAPTRRSPSARPLEARWSTRSCRWLPSPARWRADRPQPPLDRPGRPPRHPGRPRHEPRPRLGELPAGALRLAPSRLQPGLRRRRRPHRLAGDRAASRSGATATSRGYRPPTIRPTPGRATSRSTTCPVWKTPRVAGSARRTTAWSMPRSRRPALRLVGARPRPAAAPAPGRRPDRLGRRHGRCTPTPPTCAPPRCCRACRHCSRAAGARLLDLLAGWDLRMTTDSVAATVFEAFCERWHRHVLAARFRGRTTVPGHARGRAGLAMRLLSEGEPGWFGRPPSRAAVAEAAAAEALEDLERRFGADLPLALGHGPHRLVPTPAGWPVRRGCSPPSRARRPARLRAKRQRLLARRAVRRDVRSGVSPRGGPGRPGRHDDGADDGSVRLPGSPHFADMVDPWVNVDYLPLPHSPAAVEAAKTGETRLEP